MTVRREILEKVTNMFLTILKQIQGLKTDGVRVYTENDDSDGPLEEPISKLDLLAKMDQVNPVLNLAKPDTVIHLPEPGLSFCLVTNEFCNMKAF